MNDQGFSSDFFDDAEDVRTYARKRVSEFIGRQYPDLNALDNSKRSAVVDACAAQVAEAVLKKIDAGEPIDLLSLSSGLIREFLTTRGFKASASAESIRRNSRGAQGTVTDDLVTEDSVASAFTLQHAGELRYCHHAARWYEWTGNVWRMNETGIVLQQIRELTRAMSASASYPSAYPRIFATEVRSSQLIASVREHWLPEQDSNLRPFD
jgi:hypothetical protein